MKKDLIIQGGMGAGVSNWKLAASVSGTGNLGVVSGVALDVILARRLQDGDPEGTVRDALSHFPDKKAAKEILSAWFVEGGLSIPHAYRQVPMFTVNPTPEHIKLVVAAAFVEVFLARKAGAGRIGINLLEKIQLPNPYLLYGAMLAGVDSVIMGAGIPVQIPGVLASLVERIPVTFPISVKKDAGFETYPLIFDPGTVFDGAPDVPLRLPEFFPIISSNALAQTMLRKASGPIDGFIIEHHTAGGHNAPPRGQYELNDIGEPVYGSRDEVDFEGILKLNVPFYLAGGYASPDGLSRALEAGACGIQVGSPFAFCEESGLEPSLKTTLLGLIREGMSKVFTDPFASPTGFPFKVLEALGTLSESVQYSLRKRICDLGYLRTLFRKSDGTIGYRCPAEPEAEYVRKGGAPEETKGRKCLCNALMANIGHAKLQLSGYLEKPLVTTGNCLKTIRALISGGSLSYSAKDVIRYIRSERPLQMERSV